MTNTDVATRDERPPQVVLRDFLQARRGEIDKMLPNDISADVFIRAFMTGVALNPEILACSKQSIWNALLRACRDGLLPDGRDAAVVSFKGTAQYLPMYQGMLRNFRRSGQFLSVSAHIVRQGEQFDHFIDQDGEHLYHRPGDDEKAPITRAYARAKTKDGGIFIAVLSKAEVDKARTMSRTTRPDSPWNQWYEEMAKKTALRRLSKYLPSARDLLPDEDEPEVDNVPLSPQLPAEQQASAPTVSAEAARESGGEQGESSLAATETESAARTSSAVVQTETPPAAAGDLAKAYERGKQAKAAGHQRKASPPEYRDPTHTRHLLCWTAGFDDKPMPTFGAGS
jgi:phage RecT family recombinase